MQYLISAWFILLAEEMAIPLPSFLFSPTLPFFFNPSFFPSLLRSTAKRLRKTVA